MKKIPLGGSIAIAAFAALRLWMAPEAGFPAVARFEKLSDRFYYSHPLEEGGNFGILVTDEGVLLVDTPAQKDVPSMLEMLRKLTASPVSWVVNTQYHKDHTGGNGYFLEHLIPVIGSKETVRLMLSGVKERESSSQETGNRGFPASAPRFAFSRQ